MSRLPPDMASESVAVPLALHIGAFVAHARYEDLPRELVARAKLALLDTIGVAMGASTAPGSLALQRYATTFACHAPSATVFGASVTTHPRFAALVNGASSNTHDFDDTYQPSRTHPSGPVACAVLAQAEQAGASGRAALTAFVVGSEITCKVSEAMGKAHFERGYHLTGTCGGIGAAAGVAHLAGATPGRTAAALGIAASHSAGYRQNFGSTAKALHAGWAAESGVVANELADLGVEPAAMLLEGPVGFFHASGGAFDDTLLRTGLGRPWGYLSPGVAVKLYPSGQIAHPAMTAMLDLIRAHDLQSKDIARVHVRTNRALPQNLKFHAPRSGLEAQLSMEFCLAVLLVRRRAGLADYTDEAVADPAIRDMIARIDYTTYDDDEARRAGYAFLTTFIDVDTRDGRRLSVRADAAKASMGVALDANIVDKFRACLEHVRWPPDRTERALDLVLSVETLDDIRDLTVLLRA